MPDFLRSRAAGATLGFWIIRGLLAGAIAFPTLLVVVDHHGFERLPGHLHEAAIGAVTQTHLHLFETGHLHTDGSSLIDEGANIVFRANADTPWLVLNALLGLALPAVGIAFGANIRWFWARPGKRIAFDQLVARPPTPPPTVLL